MDHDQVDDVAYQIAPDENHFSYLTCLSRNCRLQQMLVSPNYTLAWIVEHEFLLPNYDSQSKITDLRLPIWESRSTTSRFMTPDSRLRIQDSWSKTPERCPRVIIVVMVVRSYVIFAIFILNTEL